MHPGMTASLWSCLNTHPPFPGCGPLPRLPQCVYDTTSRTFFKDLRFTPDMHDGGRHCSRRRGRTCLAWYTPTAVPWASVTTW